jgi:dihydrodipicolinate synthase/N-acetylneuraminate lyase
LYTDALVRVYDAYQSMGCDSAWKEFQSVLPLVRFCGLSLEMSFVTTKHLLFLAGVIESAYVRGPASALDPLNYRQLHRLASMAQLRVLDTRRFLKPSGS